ncbi:hypothetical protein DPMN_114308 [Dreissena polymorpha]|uniref:Uncharacterized protein n=1 Tax=Dreissena polymorpha TaxID=45954 RepID=A0A9D4KKM7_DREPO|nr:hypothetical protein DPMN_114308 [Dreissena polymorpha]
MASTRASSVDNEDEIAVLRLWRKKVLSKAVFLLARSKLISLLYLQQLHEGQESGIRVRYSCAEIDVFAKASMSIMNDLTDLYLNTKNIEKGKEMLSEIDTFENDYCAVTDAVMMYGQKMANRPSENKQNDDFII